MSDSSNEAANETPAADAAPGLQIMLNMSVIYHLKTLARQFC